MVGIVGLDLYNYIANSPIIVDHNRLPTLREAIDFSITSYFQMASTDCQAKQMTEKLWKTAKHITKLLLCRNRVVVRYAGQPVCPVSAPHGNSVAGRPYIRTNPSVLTKIKEVVAATRGHAAPAKVYKESVIAASSEDVRCCPRDKKQVMFTFFQCDNRWRKKRLKYMWH